jgi:hypothetical protein
MKLIDPNFKEMVEKTLKKHYHVEVHIQKIQSEDFDPTYLINVYAKDTPENEKYGYLGRSDAYAVVDKKSMLEWRKYFQSRKNIDLYEFQL